MFKKVIIQGRLEFGKELTYTKVFDMFEHMIDVRFKNAILVTEEHFDPETYLLDFDRTVIQASVKYYKNTIDLLNYMVQFAVSGTISAWLIDEGKVLNSHVFEPGSEKIVVQAYLKGKKLSEEKGKEEDAIKSLDKALKKYDRHSQAYERRAHVNYKLGNVEDAVYDYEKSIRLDARNAAAYMGLGHIKFKQKKYKDAAENFEMATKTAVALQPMYWVARRHKAIAHIKMEEWSKAEFDLRLFTKRDFSNDEMNSAHLQWAFSEYGMVLMEVGKYDEAIDAFDEALKLSAEGTKKERADKLLNRGIAKQKAGGSGFLSDWKEAAHLGDSKAKKLLEVHAN